MARDRARNSLRQAKLVNLSGTPQTLQDFVGIADKDDLYRLNIGSLSSFNVTLSSNGKTAKKANIDVELFTLKGNKAGVLQRIGKLNFSALKPSDIRRYLTRVARSSRPSQATENISIPVGAGEYYLRVHRRSGNTNYSLTLTATPEPGASPTPGPGITPTPGPGVTPTPGPGVTPNPEPSPNPTTWIKQLGTVGNDYAYGVAIDSSGSAYYAGVSESENGSRNGFVARYDAAGNQLWKRILDIDGSDIAFDVAVDSSDNYYVVGISKITQSIPGTGNDGFVAKYNSAGEQQWVKFKEADTFVPSVEAASSVAVDASGNVYVAGFQRAIPGARQSDIYIEKYSSNGNLLSNFGNSGLSGQSDAISDLSIDNVGNIYVTGVTNATLNTNLNDVINTPFLGGDAFVAKYNGTTGTQVWSRTLGGTASGGGNSQDYARGVTVVGSTVYITGDTDGVLPGQTSAGSSDGFVAQYTQSADGNTATRTWVSQFGTAALDQSQGIAADAAGNVYITGEVNASLFGSTYAGGSDAFVAKFSSTGDRLSSAQLGTSQDDEAYSIKVDPISGSLYVVGQTRGNFAGPGTQQGGYDTWITKYPPL